MSPFFRGLSMKLMMILTELAHGGAEKVVLELVRRLRLHGHDVTVVSLMPEPPPEQRAIPDALFACGAKLVFLRLTRSTPWRVLSLYRVIRAENPDVIHSHLIHPNLLGRMVNVLTRKPLVNTIHIAERRSGKGLFFFLDRLTFPLCDVCTAVSNAAARFHERKCGLKENSIRVIYNGSDPVPQASPETIASLKREWEVDSCSKIIGLLGRLDPQKGFDRFLALLPYLARKLPPESKVGIVLIGDGPERERLRRQAAEAGAQCPNLCIRMPGYRKDAASLMSMFDLFAMPSRYEGYGLTLAEAFSAGIPVFCSTADSLPELCALVGDHFFTADFDRETPDAVAERLLTALSASRYEGRVIMTNGQMYQAYLALYESLRR